jgi:hypothetical protein
VPYLISALATVAGVVVLFTMLAKLHRRARRLAETVHRCRAHFTDRMKMLSTRIAELQVALQQWRRRNGDSSRPAQAA